MPLNFVSTMSICVCRNSAAVAASSQASEDTGSGSSEIPQSVSGSPTTTAEPTDTSSNSSKQTVHPAEDAGGGGLSKPRTPSTVSSSANSAYSPAASTVSSGVDTLKRNKSAIPGSANCNFYTYNSCLCYYLCFYC